MQRAANRDFSAFKHGTALEIVKTRQISYWQALGFRVQGDRLAIDIDRNQDEIAMGAELPLAR